LAAAVVAGGLVVPGALVAWTVAPAGAQPTDPLGPTITQLEGTYATAVANAQSTLTNLEEIVEGLVNAATLGLLNPCALQNLGYLLEGGPPPCTI
jgi:hypothetical protein